MPKDSQHDMIEKKLQLAEMTIKLGKLTREKWRTHELMKTVLQAEEDMIKEIAVFTKTIDL